MTLSTFQGLGAGFVDGLSPLGRCKKKKSVVAFSWATRARRRHVAIAGQELLTLQKLQPSISAAAIAGEVRNSHEMVRWTSGARFYFPATIFYTQQQTSNQQLSISFDLATAASKNILLGGYLCSCSAHHWFCSMARPVARSLSLVLRRPIELAKPIAA